MTEPISFVFPGVPMAKGRPRAVAKIVKVGRIPKAIVQLLTPKETRIAERALQTLGRAVMGSRAPLTGPVRLMLIAVYEPPQSWTKKLQTALKTGVIYHTSKPDADNLAKLVGDALNEICYVDDSQVAELIVRKRYGYPSRTEITISALQSAEIAPADKRRDIEIYGAPPKKPENQPRFL